VVCLGKGWSSVLGPTDKVPQDENKTKSPHSDCSFLCDSCQLHCKQQGWMMARLSCQHTVKAAASIAAAVLDLSIAVSQQR